MNHSALRRKFASKDDETRNSAFFDLLYMDGFPSEFADELSRGLDDVCESNREMAAEIYAGKKRLPKAIVTRLKEMVETDVDSNVRYRAFETLATTAGNQSLVRELALQYIHGDGGLIPQGIVLVAELPNASELLGEALLHGVDFVAQSAAIALSQDGDSEAASRYFFEALVSRSEEIRGSVAVLAGEIRPWSSELENALITAANLDGDLEVRATCASTLLKRNEPQLDKIVASLASKGSLKIAVYREAARIRLGLGRNYGVFRRAMASTDESMRSAVRSALWAIGLPSEKLVEIASIGLFREGTRVLFQELFKRTPEQSLPVLKRLLASKETKPHHRRILRGLVKQMET